VVAARPENFRGWAHINGVTGDFHIDFQKFQIPTSKLQRNSKQQTPKIRGAIFECWSLELLWNLVLGIWSLRVSAPASFPTKRL
jgi:hypothetical protein